MFLSLYTVTVSTQTGAKYVKRRQIIGGLSVVLVLIIGVLGGSVLARNPRINVVGNGTAASCTETALNAVLTIGFSVNL
jgi:hypothetical protein